MQQGILQQIFFENAQGEQARRFYGQPSKQLRFGPVGQKQIATDACDQRLLFKHYQRHCRHVVDADVVQKPDGISSVTVDER